jgi:hypothetical protein
LPHLSSQCHIIIWGTPREKGTFGHILWHFSCYYI